MGAKIINSISFQNFYNFYGDYDNNTYHFKKGLNIIVADNGAGKSKFYNGILWILKDIVYDSELKKEDKIEDVLFKVLSDKAKDETSVGDSVRVGVKLTFQGSQFEYIIEKYYYSKRIKEGSAFDEKCWKIESIEIEVSKRDLYLKVFHLVYDLEEQKRIIESVILPGLQPYALLQGEEIDKIIDFTRKDSLNNAIDKLTNINRFKSLVVLSDYLSGRANKDLDAQRKLHTKNAKEFDDEVAKKEKLEIELSKKEALLKTTNQTLSKAREEKANLLNSITNAEKRNEFRIKIGVLESKKRDLDLIYENYFDKINSYFFDPEQSWLLLHLEGEMKVFSNRRDAYLEERLKAKLSKEIHSEIFTTVLPDGSPDYVSLEKMLQQELCFVCGRKAKKGSKEWLHIKNVKERPKQVGLSEDISKNDFRDFFGDIQLNSQEFYKRIPGINDSITALRNKIIDIDNQIRDVLKNKESLEQELFQFGGSIKDPNERDKDKSILESYGNTNQRIGQCTEETKRYEREIEELNSQITKCSKTIAELGGSDFPKVYEETSELLIDIHKVFCNTKDRIYSEILMRLEKNANIHFQKLTIGNNADGGILKLTKTSTETVILEVIDGHRNPITGLSEGFQRMKKLAVIMAIISSRNNQQTLDYPLIADAPLSAFGKSFIEGFFNEVPNVFNQSIILVKELYDKDRVSKLSETGERILKKQEIGSFYLNEIEENKSQSERITKIIPYK